MKVLVTGVAGFIGFTLARKLLERGDEVIGIDSVNDYYDVQLKWDRLKQIEGHPRFRFAKINLTDSKALEQVFDEFSPTRVVNLAAQAGVRYSLTHPHTYVQSNIVGFLNILEACRHRKVEHLVFASSSSVYGANRKLPFSVNDGVDHPVSLYAASKKANELMAHSYSHLYRLPTTGLRFFTVYGPWGRPDMALFMFTKNILAGQPIDVFNYGKHRRDFTYVDDIIEGVMRVLDHPAMPDPNWNGLGNTPGTSSAPYRIYNIGNHNPVWLNDLIAALENELGKKAIKNPLPMQEGDVLETFADIDDLTRDFDFTPSTSIQEGVKNFVSWYRSYYKQ